MPWRIINSSSPSRFLYFIVKIRLMNLNLLTRLIASWGNMPVLSMEIGSTIHLKVAQEAEFTYILDVYAEKQK